MELKERERLEMRIEVDRCKGLRSHRVSDRLRNSISVLAFAIKISLACDSVVE